MIIYFFIKISLFRLFNTQEWWSGQHTEVYKFYIDKTKLHWYDIGSGFANTQNFLDRIGSEKIVSLHP